MRTLIPALVVLLVGSVTVLAATSWQDRTRRAITTVALVAAVVLWMNVVVPWSDRRQVQDSEIRDSYALMSPSDVVVLDGETMRATIDDERVVVHLIGIDVPSYAGQPEQKECLATKAEEALRQSIEVEIDRIGLETRNFDAGDAEMSAYLWVDSEMINLRLIDEGYVWLDTYAEHRDVDEFYEHRNATWDRGATDVGVEHCPFVTTTTRPIASRPATTQQPRSTTKWQSNQYGCHSDGRCLDDDGVWCDESDLIYREDTGEELCP